MKYITGNRLRFRIDIQDKAIIQNSEDLTVTEEWQSVLEQPGTLPAEKVPLSGREFIAAAAVQAGVSVRFCIRKMDGITPVMRVVHDGLFYNIKAVLPDPMSVHHINLMCEEGVNEG
jgi:SPP1 family predicted phage head-tail adaptor